MKLSDAQDWAVRAIANHGGVMSASRLGAAMLERPGLDTTGKTYSSYTLGRMGGGIIMHLKRSGMVRSRKVRGLTVAALTAQGRAYTAPDTAGMSDGLATFLADVGLV